MEIRFFSIFLTAVGSFLLLLNSAYADDSLDQEESLGQVVEQSVERRAIDESAIDTEDFEVTAYAGILSIEDFGTSGLTGFKLAYHVSEHLFVEGSYGLSEANETTFERLNNTRILTDEQREYSFYNIVFGYNFLGETFIGKDHAFNSAFYVVTGVGSTDFAGDDIFTITFGSGYRLLLNDAFAVHVDFRDHIFDLDILGENKTLNNLELSFGASYFF